MFDLFTKSRFFGRPVELYRFVYASDPEQSYRYTDAEFPVTYGGELYSPIPIKRGTSTNNGTLDKSVLEVNVPYNTEVPELFRVAPPTFAVTLTIYQGEAEDSAAEYKPLWSGRVLGCSWQGVEAKLNCEPISTALTRVGLRRNFQYMCPHMLYGDNCRADKLAATGTTTIDSFLAKSVTVPVAVTPTEYVSGMVEWEVDNILVRRTIISCTVAAGKTTFNLNGLASKAAFGVTVKYTKGCAHTLTFCRDVHGNANNFGGHPWIPLKNPISNISPFS